MSRQLVSLELADLGDAVSTWGSSILLDLETGFVTEPNCEYSIIAIDVGIDEEKETIDTEFTEQIADPDNDECNLL